MKRYTFRMEKVLRVRRLQEDAARAGVTSARASQQQAETALSVSHDHYRSLPPAAGATPAASFLGLRDQASYRATAVRVAQGRHDEAATATAHAVTLWQDSHRRVEALERLDDRRRDDYAVEVRRAEDTAADEIVVSRARARA